MPDRRDHPANFLAARLFIVASNGRLRVPRFGRLATLRLSPLHLEVLLALANESVVAKGEDGELTQVVDELRDRELIRLGDESSPRVDSVSGSPPDSPVEDPEVLITGPVVFRVRPDGFEHLDHDGAPALLLSAPQLVALGGLTSATPTLRRAALNGLTGDDLESMLSSCRRAGLVAPVPTGESNTSREIFQARYLTHARVRDRLAERGLTPDHRIPVIPVVPPTATPPGALGLILSYASAHDGGRLHESFDLDSRWLVDVRQAAIDHGRPSVFLFSNYVWGHDPNLAASNAMKAENPAHITIHGGPDTPKYAADAEQYLRSHPHVDVIVRGEGEITAAEILSAFAERGLNRDALIDVAGCSFLLGDRFVETPDRDRLVDLDIIPSPFLNGTMDDFVDPSWPFVVIETNRGCPYGCTFCDWGSATASRIRKFSLDRVMAEIEWAAHHQFRTLSVADANFGIFERDVEIAERVAELKVKCGFPQQFITNYAKNTVKHLSKIVTTLADAGIVSEGLLSLQTMDDDTLSIIRRSNIKVEKYDQLAVEFRAAGLPLYVDLMIGLPGATPASMCSDLQECVDREVTAKLIPTELLINSPMNAPEYRDEHRIVTMDDPKQKSRKLLVSTASYTRAEYDEMMDLRRLYVAFETYGLCRHVSRFVRQSTNVEEIDLYRRILEEANAHPDQWPHVHFSAVSAAELVCPPVSWRPFVDELSRMVHTVFDVPDDSAWKAVAQVQHAVLPSPGRKFPLKLQLSHDYAEWHRQVLAAKSQGHGHDWQAIVPALSQFGPNSFEVTDPREVSSRLLGRRYEDDIYGNLELRSPVARAMTASA